MEIASSYDFIFKNKVFFMNANMTYLKNKTLTCTAGSYLQIKCIKSQEFKLKMFKCIFNLKIALAIL